MKRQEQPATSGISRNQVLTITGLSFAMLIALFIVNSSDSPPESKPEAAIEMPEGPRLAVLKGFDAFTDRSALVEMLEARRKMPNPTDEFVQAVLRPLRLRHLAEGRRIDFDRDHIVRLVSEEPELEGFCQVFAEDPPKASQHRLWIMEESLA